MPYRLREREREKEREREERDKREPPSPLSSIPTTVSLLPPFPTPCLLCHGGVGGSQCRASQERWIECLRNDDDDDDESKQGAITITSHHHREESRLNLPHNHSMVLEEVKRPLPLLLPTTSDGIH